MDFLVNLMFFGELTVFKIQVYDKWQFDVEENEKKMKINRKNIKSFFDKL